MKKSENELLDAEPKLPPEFNDSSESDDEMPDFPHTYMLKKPIKDGKRMITELVFNEPTAGDLLSIESTGNLSIFEILQLIGKFSLVAPSKLKDLGPFDLNACIDLVKLFLSPIKGPEDSAKGSAH